MAQNSASISMTKLRNDAFLADAGYENMGGNKEDDLPKKGEIITNDQTVTKFEVIDQKRDSNGFDMTIFKEVGTKNADKAREFESLPVRQHTDKIIISSHFF